jgi:hypothetical protein
MNLQYWLDRYNETVLDYDNLPFDQKMKSAELMKDMAVILSYLTMERIEVQKKWIAFIFNQKNTMSNAAAEKLADSKYPELYQLRRIHEAGKAILDTMRSQISLLKQE